MLEILVFEIWTSYPVGSCHLNDDFSCSPAEVSSIAAHHHSASLTVPQVDGGQQTLDIILKIVLFTFKNRCLLSQPIRPWSLVIEGGSLDSQNGYRVSFHDFMERFGILNKFVYSWMMCNTVFKISSKATEEVQRQRAGCATEQCASVQVDYLRRVPWRFFGKLVYDSCLLIAPGQTVK